MKKSLTSYDILNISEQATQDEIHAAYKRLAKAWHPDRHGQNARDSSRAHHHFILLKQAYDNIATPNRRTEYNHRLAKMKRTVMTQQNKVMNDNSPLKNLFQALETIFNPIERKS